VFGLGLRTIERIGAEIEELLAPLRGTASIFAERAFGGRYLDVEPDRAAVARYGLTVGQVQEVIQTALGGMNITTAVEGRERYPVQVRYARAFCDDPRRLGHVLIATPQGPQVPLLQLVTTRFTAGAPMIKSEDGQLVGTVLIDVRGRDVGQLRRRGPQRGAASGHVGTRLSAPMERPVRGDSQGETAARNRRSTSPRLSRWSPGAR
jgi:Cu(I)/Ag(I) efflux system membrane protein CusA/SilA